MWAKKKNIFKKMEGKKYFKKFVGKKKFLKKKKK
jgi:hypothetical protein